MGNLKVTIHKKPTLSRSDDSQRVHPRNSLHKLLLAAFTTLGGGIVNPLTFMCFLSLINSL